MVDKVIVGLLLAAGSSRRFGSDKLLWRLPNAVPMAVQSCRCLGAGVDRVLAILRPGSDRLASALAAEGAEIRYCAESGEGMGSSLACGVRASPTADGWLIGLGDMPWVRPDTVRRLAELLRSGAPIVAPVHAGRRGHPVGFSRPFGDSLGRIRGDEGARSLIARHRARLCALPCDDPGILKDVDVPDDVGSGMTLPLPR